MAKQKITFWSVPGVFELKFNSYELRRALEIVESDPKLKDVIFKHTKNLCYHVSEELKKKFEEGTFTKLRGKFKRDKVVNEETFEKFNKLFTEFVEKEFNNDVKKEIKGGLSICRAVFIKSLIDLVNSNDQLRRAEIYDEVEKLVDEKINSKINEIMETIDKRFSAIEKELKNIENVKIELTGDQYILKKINEIENKLNSLKVDFEFFKNDILKVLNLL